jgi:hypothetical protein
MAKRSLAAIAKRLETKLKRKKARAQAKAAKASLRKKIETMRNQLSK